MVAFTYRMPAGIPGAINRSHHATVEAQVINPAAPPTAYGVPVAIEAAGVRPITGGDVAATVAGMLVRPYPTNSSADGLGVNTPPVKGICNVLTRGYLMVALGGVAAAVKSAPVFVRVAGAATGKPIGGIEAAADSTNTIQIANAHFMGPADAGGITEIAFNI